MIDKALLRRVLLDLRVATDDADTVAVDMLRSPRQRQLGPALHRSQYREARAKVVSQIAYLLRMVDGEPQPPTVEH
jgi:hypothetical protein